MGRYGQLVMGPAGAGKSTYCATMQKHCESTKRSAHVVNLDPAAEIFEYAVSIDIRDLITIDDVMEEIDLGPNGGLVYCMEYLISHSDWLEEQLGQYEDDYLIFDLPGQIELYSHIGVVPRLIEMLTNMGYHLCAVYLLDSHFMSDAGKFIAGTMQALSAMLHLELPHVSVITKMDLLPNSETDSEMYAKFFDTDIVSLLEEMKKNTPKRFHNMNTALAQVIDDYNMVTFVPLNIMDEDSISICLQHVDNAMQYGEDEEPKEPKDDDYSFLED